MNCEHLLPNQVEAITETEDMGEDCYNIVTQHSDEASNCGEVRLVVAAEGVEGDIFTASAFDVPTIDEALV